jgi:hypothetical protein
MLEFKTWLENQEIQQEGLKDILKKFFLGGVVLSAGTLATLPFIKGPPIAAQGGQVQVAVPNSRTIEDLIGGGHKGFAINVNDFKVTDFNIENATIDPDAGWGQKITFATLKGQLPGLIQGQLQNTTSYAFQNGPPGSEADMTQQKDLAGFDGILILKNVKIYPQPGNNWFVIVNGSVKIKIGSGNIAPVN